MLLFWQNHRLGQKPEFVFAAKNPENASTESENKELPKVDSVKSEFLEYASKQNLDLSKDVWPKIEKAADQWVDENHGPEKMRGDLAQDLNVPVSRINLSKKAKEGLAVLKVEFKTDLKKNYDIAQGLEVAKKNEAKLAEKGEGLQKAIDGSQNRSEVEKALLDGLIPALDEKYLNLDGQEKILKLKKDQFSEYKTLSGKFKDNVQENAKGRLETVFRRFGQTKDAGILKTDLESIRDDITATYKSLASPEGFINLDSLGATAKMASRCVDFSKMLNSPASKEEMLKIMDARDFFARKESIVAAGGIAESIIRKVRNDGAEKKFIEAVNSEIKSEKEATDFDEACELFDRELKTQTQLSFRKGFDLAEKVSQKVFGADVEAKGLDTLSPAFQEMVGKERKIFLSPEARLGNVDDIRLRDFMQLNTREQREGYLANPTKSATLFKSINTIIGREEGKEDQEWKGKFPKKGEKIITGFDYGHPTTYNLLARHLAVVGLAKEAKTLIENLDSTDAFNGMNLKERLVAAKPDENPAPSDYKFKDNFVQPRARYVSEVERAGFNRRDIGFAVLQAWGAITFFLNAKNAWSGWGKIDETLAKMAQNPFIYLGGGAVLGPHSLRKDPESLGYLTQSKGGQERILEHWRFRSISEEVGYTSFKNFVTNNAGAMRDLVGKDPQRTLIKEALANAEKRPGKPVLLNTDFEKNRDKKKEGLKPIIVTPQDRIRYLFYKKFLMDPKVNLEQLLKNCQEWQG
jgi:hypothetical protein